MRFDKDRYKNHLKLSNMIINIKVDVKDINIKEYEQVIIVVRPKIYIPSK